MIVRGAVIAGLVSLICGVFAGSAAAAAPNFRALAVTGPTHLPPISQEVQLLDVDATGGTYELTAYRAVGRGSGQLASPNATTISLPTMSEGALAVGQELTGERFAPGTTVTAVTELFGTIISVTISKPATNTAPVAAEFYIVDASGTTEALPHDASADAVESALNELPVLADDGGTVEVEEDGSEAPGVRRYAIRFGGTLASVNVPPLRADGSQLTGGAGTAAITTDSQGGEPGEGEVAVVVTNVGGAPTDGSPIAVSFALPAGIEPVATSECAAVGQQVTCERAEVIPALATANSFMVPVRVHGAAPSEATVNVTVSGGGVGPHTLELDVVVSEQPAPPGIEAVWAAAFDENGVQAAQAGEHPFSAGAGFTVTTIQTPNGQVIPAGDAREVRVALPPGFIGNPLVTDRCPQDILGSCDGADVGVVRNLLQGFGGDTQLDLNEMNPVVNGIPAPGFAAQFSFKVFEARASVLGRLRSDADYGVELIAPNLANEYRVFGNITMLSGVPQDAEGKAFLTSPMNCNDAAPITQFRANTWQAPDIWSEGVADIPPVVGCDKLEFTPGFTFQPSTSEAATGTATTAHVHVDQARLLEPDKLAPPHLKDSVVTLPEGLTLNPAAANGLEACTTAQIGYKGDGFPMPNPMRFDKEPVKCPDASKIGRAEIKTPLLDKPLEGIVYLAAQDDNPFKSLLAMYIVVDDEETGIVVKLPGEVIPNEQTGQLKAVFQNNPQVPFEDLILRFRGGGPRSTLATPDVCGTYTTNGSWTPWSAPESGPPAATQNSFTIDSGPGGGACAASKAQRPFGLGFEAGTTDPKAGGHSPFTLRITRPDGAQELDKVTVTTPPGLVATLKGIPYCPEAALAAAQDRNRKGREEMANPSCPAASQVGTTTIGVGVGSEPLYVKTGKVYLTGPYKGAPVGLAFVVPAVAGPFDLGVQVVRTALRVNPRTAQVTAESDEIPKLLKGIPLLIRDVRVDLDRPGFVRNPTNCEPMTLGGQVSGASGAVADVSTRFQVDGCAALGFKPKMQLRLKGGTTRAKYQQLTATVWARPGDANIGRASVTFPRSIFLAQEHIRTVCTRVQFAADKCPKGSVYGQAEAITPLLDEPLKGPVYLRSSDNLLPDLVAALEGPAHQPIKVELVGRTDSKNRGLRNTFDIVPDAPVTKFTLRMQGGKKSLLVTSRNICKRTERATVKLNGQNGRRHNFRQPLTVVNCKKKAKRKASAKRRRG